jgi:hypothetical protein
MILSMSAFGPKRTSLAAPNMSVFWVKADMPIASDNRVYRMLRFMFPIVGSGASQQA